jgi:ubiquinone/menaquinone biosynthesis C-methylase UbiE|uniref:Class I SAM-dependent methyltransferase n=1 Tax=candidate division CPR3 bacterium TaxID=2268181 RepID=A0A7V3J9L6_UNCC3
MKDFNKLDFFIQKMRAKLIEKYVPYDSYLLDLGCGLHPMALIMLESKIKKAIGIDKEVPSRSFSKKIDFLKADLENGLPFSEGEFDCVLMLAVLEHLKFPKEVIEESYRVLKPGGKIIITIPTNFSQPILELLASLGIISKEEVFSHRHYFRINEVKNLLSRVHFKVILVKPYNLFLNALYVAEK